MLHLPPLKIFMPGAAGGYIIEGGALFDGSTGYLSWTPSGAGDSTVQGTLEVVWKRNKTNDRNTLLDVVAGSDGTQLAITSWASTNDYYYGDMTYSATNHRRESSRVVRDLSGWQQTVYRFDTGNASAGLRWNIFHNGTEIDYDTYNETIAQNQAILLGSANPHYIGAYQGSLYFFDGYIARVTYIDGQALDPTSFGELTTDGYWQINDVSNLTFGTNGFLLEGGVNIAAGRNNLATTTDLVEGTTGWTGATANWTVTRDLVTSNSANKSMYWNTALSGDFDFEVLIASESSGDGLVLGVIASANIGSFNSASASAGCFTGNFGQYIACSNDNYREGNSGATSFTGVAAGDRVGIRRVGTTVSITINGSVDTNFPSTLSGDCYVFIGSGDASYESKNMLLNDGGTVTALGDWIVKGSVTSTSDGPVDDATSGYGNFATLDPNVPSGLTYSEGNTKATSTSGTWRKGFSTIAVPGDADTLFYFEANVNSHSNYYGVGIGTGPEQASTLSGFTLGYEANEWGLIYDGSANLSLYNNDVSSSSGLGVPTTNERLCVAFNPADGNLWLGLEGVYPSSGDPAAGTNPTYSGISAAKFLAAVAERETTQHLTMLFDSADWDHAPTGATSIATQNITPPAVVPSEHADIILSTGTGLARTVSGGSDFGSDDQLIIGKNRSAARAWHWTDSINGAGNYLNSASTAALSADANAFTSINSDGFGLGTGSDLNGSGENVAFIRLRAGTSGSNSDGSITATVSANQTSGFSIVKFTGTGANATVGHGLGVPPSMIILKRTDGAYSWVVYHSGLTSASYILNLDTTGAETLAADYWNSTAPTSTVFSVGTNNGTNGSGGTMVAYCFADVSDLATSIFRIGSYTGNGSADGPMITQDASILGSILKRTNTAGYDWYWYDSVREPTNPVTAELNPNTSEAEAQDSSDGIDYLSNGMKNRAASNYHNNGTIIYMHIIDKFLAGGSKAWTQGRAR